MTNEQLCLLAQGGNNDAQNELIENVLPSLHAAAGKLALYYSGTSVESDDLIQIASQGPLNQRGHVIGSFALDDVVPDGDDGFVVELAWEPHVRRAPGFVGI